MARTIGIGIQEYAKIIENDYFYNVRKERLNIVKSIFEMEKRSSVEASFLTRQKAMRNG